MEFRQVGKALDSAQRLGMADFGEAGIAVPALRRKDAESAKLPAKFTGQRQREVDPAAASKAHMRHALPKVDRGMPTATKASTPHARAVGRPMFIVIEGGRSPAGRSDEAPTDRSSPRGQAREFLKLAHAAPRSMTD